MANVDLTPLLNPHHKKIHASEDRELLVYGGANSGKSFSIADKMLLLPIWQPGVTLRAAVVRRTLPSLRRSALYILERRAAEFGFPFKENKADWTARVYNLEILFLSMNNKEDYDKLKSITDLDFIWINELPQIRETDYDELLLRLRGGRSRYEQIVADFNPIGKTSWVYKRFWETDIGKDAKKLHYTIDDNHPSYLADPKTKAWLDAIEKTKRDNPNYYKIYRLGEWGELEGVIFNWDSVPLPDIAWDEIFYGLDFGFTDPAAVIKIYRKGKEYWVDELIYETGLTNQALAARMLSLGVSPKSYVYCDSAEPKSIKELRDAGINAQPAIKGPDSVQYGIQYLLSLKIHIIEGSEWTSREARSYVRKKDKDGRFIEEPIEHNNHAMSAIRYGITTSTKKPGGYIAFSKDNFY